MKEDTYHPSKELIAARDSFIDLVNQAIRKKNYIAPPSEDELKNTALPPLNRFEGIKRRYHAEQLEYDEKIKQERARCAVEQANFDNLKAVQARLLEIDGYIDEAERLAGAAGGKEVDAAKQRFKKALESEREQLKEAETAMIKKGYANINRCYPNFPAESHQKTAVLQYHRAKEQEQLHAFLLVIDTAPVHNYLTTLLCLSTPNFRGESLKDVFCKKIGEAVFASLFGDLELNSVCQVSNAKFTREGLEKIQLEESLQVIEFLQSPEELTILDKAA